MNKSSKIKPYNESIDEKDKRTLIKANDALLNNRERAIVFSFANFQRESKII